MSRKHMVRTSFTKETQEDLLVIAMEIKNKLALNIAVFPNLPVKVGELEVQVSAYEALLGKPPSKEHTADLHAAMYIVETMGILMQHTHLYSFTLHPHIPTNRLIFTFIA